MVVLLQNKKKTARHVSRLTGWIPTTLSGTSSMILGTYVNDIGVAMTDSLLPVSEEESVGYRAGYCNVQLTQARGSI